MSKITVRTMLAAILENNLQMDDNIDFYISPETEEVSATGEVFELQLVSTETHIIKGRPEKTLVFVFDLNEVNEED